MKEYFKLSILTPVYNREDYILSVIKSLKKQTGYSFEWIVANDGSTDKTLETIIENTKNCKFNITIINASKRLGKPAMDNLLLKHANGDYITWCDSDDYFTDDAFKVVDSYLKEIDKNKNDQLIGCIFQNVDQNGISQSFNSNFVPKKKELVSHNKAQKYLKGDATIIINRNIAKKLYFKEVDFIYTEGATLEKQYKNKNFFISNIIIKIMDRTARNSVSFGKKLRFSRGLFYSIIELNTQEIFQKLTFFSKIKLVINYWRYSIHGDIQYAEAKKMWGIINKNYFFTFLYLISLIVSLLDYLKGKVEKTHLELEKNKNDFKIEIMKINENTPF